MNSPKVHCSPEIPFRCANTPPTGSSSVFGLRINSSTALDFIDRNRCQRRCCSLRPFCFIGLGVGKDSLERLVGPCGLLLVTHLGDVQQTQEHLVRERSEKDRFDMAYSTGFRKLELRLSQLTQVMYAVGEN